MAPLGRGDTQLRAVMTEASADPTGAWGWDGCRNCPKVGRIGLGTRPASRGRRSPADRQVDPPAKGKSGGALRGAASSHPGKARPRPDGAPGPCQTAPTPTAGTKPGASTVIPGGSWRRRELSHRTVHLPRALSMAGVLQATPGGLGLGTLPRPAGKPQEELSWSLPQLEPRGRAPPTLHSSGLPPCVWAGLPALLCSAASGGKGTTSARSLPRGRRASPAGLIEPRAHTAPEAGAGKGCACAPGPLCPLQLAVASGSWKGRGSWSGQGEEGCSMGHFP